MLLSSIKCFADHITNIIFHVTSFIEYFPYDSGDLQMFSESLTVDVNTNGFSGFPVNFLSTITSITVSTVTLRSFTVSLLFLTV